MNRPKRQLILQGMLEAVGADGYERTSVRTVLFLAGVYRQAFYDSFQDKEDCYLRALDVGIEEVEGRMRAATAGRRTWRGQLRAALAALLVFLDVEPDVGRALLVEVHAAGPRALARRTEAMEQAAAYIDRARAEGGVAAPPIAGEAVVAGIFAVLHSRLAAHRDGRFAPLLPELMFLAVLPYFGPEKAAEEMCSARDRPALG